MFSYTGKPWSLTGQNNDQRSSSKAIISVNKEESVVTSAAQLEGGLKQNGGDTNAKTTNS